MTTSSPISISRSAATRSTSSRSSGPADPRRTGLYSTTRTGNSSDVPIAVQISCMECGGTAVLRQLPSEDDVVEAGDVLTYRCPDCGQRWDVVVDDDDITEE